MRYLVLIVVAASFVAIPIAPVGSAVGGLQAARLPRVEIHAGPPPQRDESPPRRRPGYVWVPGYWTWSGERFVWMKGRHVRSKRDSFRHAPYAGGETDGRYRLYRLDQPGGRELSVTEGER